ncbi:phage major capsid protein [Komagataeibacter medellinensis]|uniref:Bacteriophage protein n=1 Tax=Komagataeibacter medellinensis (strain NBRC 3288 / BCRC 11682 / LMG 1693 / Kondo 51) TaxID=634177 RepID=G2I0U6_KOMMN|nr:phage major capsid protein [Komagataeibacter medellinensis]BAK84554.1 bacteriophage protein [Komagataeibacter medellinensis NBRC 3288]
MPAPINLESLKELRRQRKKAADDYRNTVARLEERAIARVKAAEDGSPVDPETAQTEDKADNDAITALERTIAGLDTRIGRVEEVLNLDAQAATDPENPDLQQEAGMSGGVTRTIIGVPFKQKLAAGGQFIHYMLTVGHAKKYGFQSALKYAKEGLGNTDVERALAAGGQTTGGALVPQQFVADLIELLRAATVVRRAGARTIDMATGNLTMPRLAGGATSGYQDELDDIGISQETFDDLQFNAKKLTTMVPVSNDLIRRAAMSVDQIVRDDLIASASRREDLAFLLGAGTLKDPIGILNMGGSVIAGGAATLTGAINTLQACELTLKNGNSRMITPVWIFHPAVEAFLKGLTNEVGGYFFRDEMNTGKLSGYDYYTTTQLPTNLQADGKGSYIFFVDMADILIGDAYTADIEVSYEGAYAGTDGVMVSAFQRDQTIFRIIREHDIQTRHLQSIAVADVDAWIPGGWTGMSAGAPYTTQALNTSGSAAQSANPTSGTTTSGSSNSGTTGTTGS